MTDKELINKAIQAVTLSYSPYSSFSVGAALLCADSRVYIGCNIENSSYPATVCAERTAFFNAITDKSNDFVKIAIVGGKNGNINDFCYPCGVCLQVMNEFCNKDFIILLYNGQETKELYLHDLLPHGFGRDSLCE